MKNRSYILGSPVFIVALVTLFVNDFYLKFNFPGILTGKLSDIAGLFIFPIFLYFIHGKNKRSIYLLTALTFAFWKSTLSQNFIDFCNYFSPLKFGRVVDYSDYFTMLILPVSYYYNFNSTRKLNNCYLRYGLSVLTLLVIVASETVDVKFKNKVKGYTPWGLVGNYAIYYTDADTSYIDTICFEQVKRRKYLIIKNSYDTLYTGDIVKVKGNFYLNNFDKVDGYWRINSFKIKDDSIFNFYETFYTRNVVSIDSNNFKNVIKTEKDDEVTYFINNGKTETFKAFNKLLNKAKGYFIKEIILQSNTTIGDAEVNEIKEHKSTKITVYPNPFSEHINIAQTINAKYTVRILSINGQLINTIESSELITQINTSNLHKGTYLLEYIDSNNNYETVKLIKQ